MIADQETGQLLIENIGAIFSVMRDRRHFKKMQESRNISTKKRDCSLMIAALYKLSKDGFIKEECKAFVGVAVLALENEGPIFGLTDTPEFIKWLDVMEISGHFRKYPLYRMREIILGDPPLKKIHQGDSFTVLYDKIEGSHYQAVEAVAMKPPQLLQTIEERIDDSLKQLNIKIDMKADELSCGGELTAIVVQLGAELLKKKIDKLFYRLPRIG